MSPLPLIGLAHGSRHPEVAASIDQVMAATQAIGGMPTYSAYLDLTAPDLTTVATELAARGHGAAVVVPLLFTSAFHARVDVPEAVRDAAETSGVALAVADILGTGDDVLEVASASASAAGVAADASILLFAVGSSDAAANDAVDDLAARFSASRAGAVRAGFGTAEPRGSTVLAELIPPKAVVPLFVSPGLLLDPIARLAAQGGHGYVGPLGERVAPLVVSRYRQACSAGAGR